MHLSGVEVIWRSPPESPFPNHHRHHTCKTEAGAVHTSQCVSLGTYLHILIGLFLIILLIITIFVQIKFPFGMYSHMREWHLQWISCWNAVDPLKCLWSQGPLQFCGTLVGLMGQALPMSLNPIWTWGQVTWGIHSSPEEFAVVLMKIMFAKKNQKTSVRK